MCELTEVLDESRIVLGCESLVTIATHTRFPLSIGTVKSMTDFPVFCTFMNILKQYVDGCKLSEVVCYKTPRTFQVCFCFLEKLVSSLKRADIKILRCSFISENRNLMY